MCLCVRPVGKLQEDTLVIAAEEIDRLERELSRMTRRSDRATARYKAAEQSLGMLKVRVAELQTQRDELFLKKDLDTALQLSAHRASASRAKVQRRSSVAGASSAAVSPQVAGVGSPGTGTGTPGAPASGATPKAPGSTRRLSVGSTTLEFRDAVSPLGSARSAASGAASGAGSTVADKDASVSLAVHQAAIDTYKRREGELLQALEGVVKRCQELESTSRTRSNQ